MKPKQIVGRYRGIVVTGNSQLDVWNEMFRHYHYHIPFNKIKWGDGC